MAGNENSGGARLGSGRKKKQNPHILEVFQVGMTMENDYLEEEIPKPNKVLCEFQLDGSTLQASEIYEKTWLWLENRGCTALISPELLDRYAMMYARWLHCEEHISRLGYIGSHPTTGGEVQSPYVKMSQDYMAQINRLWLEIYSIVKENSTGSHGSIIEIDPMEALLSGM